MFPYLIIIILIVISINYNRRMNKRLRLFNMFIIWSIVSLVFGLRYRVGIDTINYMSLFDGLPDISSFIDIDWEENKTEPGFLAICVACKSICNEFWFTQLVLAGITNGLMFLFIYKQCKNPFVGVFLYSFMAMFYFTTEIMRESIAIGIFLNNLNNYNNANWKKYYFICCLSIVFHFSAILTLFFPLVRFLKFNIWYIIICFGIIFIAPVFESINQLLTLTTIANKIRAYTLQADDVNINYRIFNIIYIGIPAFCSMFLLYIKKIQTEYLQFLLLHVLFCCGIFAIPIIFSRFANYTLLIVIVTAANLLSFYKLKLYIKSIFLCLIILSQSLYLSSMYHAWIPYVSIFNPVKVEERESLWFLQFG